MFIIGAVTAVTFRRAHPSVGQAITVKLESAGLFAVAGEWAFLGFL